MVLSNSIKTTEVYTSVVIYKFHLLKGKNPEKNSTSININTNLSLFSMERN